jgi:hypothetical protein
MTAGAAAASCIAMGGVDCSVRKRRTIVSDELTNLGCRCDGLQLPQRMPMKPYKLQGPIHRGVLVLGGLCLLAACSDNATMGGSGGKSTAAKGGSSAGAGDPPPPERAVRVDRHRRQAAGPPEAEAPLAQPAPRAVGGRWGLAARSGQVARPRRGEWRGPVGRPPRQVSVVELVRAGARAVPGASAAREAVNPRAGADEMPALIVRLTPTTWAEGARMAAPGEGLRLAEAAVRRPAGAVARRQVEREPAAPALADPRGPPSTTAAWATRRRGCPSARSPSSRPERSR